MSVKDEMPVGVIRLNVGDRRSCMSALYVCDIELSTDVGDIPRASALYVWSSKGVDQAVLDETTLFAA